MSDTEPQPAPMTAMNFWDAQLRTTAGLISEARQEYVSKDRLRNIALLALAQLYAMFSNGREEELAAQEAPKSGLLVPDTPPSGIISLS